MYPLFQTFSQILSDSEKLQFTILKEGSDGLKVIVTPEIREAEKNLSDEHVNLRSALAMPLVMSGDASLLDAEFFDVLSQYANKRTALNSAIGALGALDEANKKAADAVSKGKKGEDSNTPVKGGDNKNDSASIGNSTLNNDDDISLV